MNDIHWVKAIMCHDVDRVLSMDNAKVTPAAVHEGYQNTHPNTFIIT
jgi:hypothetical protein